MSQQEFLYRYSSCVSLQLLVAIRNYLFPVLFVATEIIFVVTEILLLFVVNSECYVEQDFLCCDSSFSLSWFDVENFVAT